MTSMVGKRSNQPTLPTMKGSMTSTSRTSCLSGSHGCGKTTLAETMLFEAGLIQRRGRVEDKNTVSDYHDLEHERGSSEKHRATPSGEPASINIIDTPGLDDRDRRNGAAPGPILRCVLNAENAPRGGRGWTWCGAIPALRSCDHRREPRLTMPTRIFDAHDPSRPGALATRQP